ncbi:MAG: site-2 protease family protein [Nitrospinales bacterium]
MDKPTSSSEAPPPSLLEEDRKSASFKRSGWKAWFVFFFLLSTTLFTTYLAGGPLFSISLIAILGAHEFGHYWASRRNRVDATLPYFMPAPPVFIAGTFGAFIKIKGAIPDRRVLMEIGAAGPIAGFIVAVPTLIVGLFLSRTMPAAVPHGVSFGSSLVLGLCSKIILGVSPLSPDFNIELHPIAFAGWIGLLVTAFNLLPIGQLDGGHIIYSLFRDRYAMLSKLFFVFLFPLGYFWQGWWFWAFLIALFGFKPAPVIDDSLTLEKKHKVMGFVSIFIFVATFVPVPFEIMR